MAISSRKVTEEKKAARKQSVLDAQERAKAKKKKFNETYFPEDEDKKRGHLSGTAMAHQGRKKCRNLAEKSKAYQDGYHAGYDAVRSSLTLNEVESRRGNSDGNIAANQGFEKCRDLAQRSKAYQDAYNTAYDAVRNSLTPNEFEAKRGHAEGINAANHGYEKLRDLAERSKVYQDAYNAAYDAKSQPRQRANLTSHTAAVTTLGVFGSFDNNSHTQTPATPQVVEMLLGLKS